MDDKHLESANFHFRFKFLAVTTIAFLLYVVLSSSAEFDQFASTPQFKLMGPFFLITAIMFLVFRKFPIKCPYCHKTMPTKKNWKCPHCERMQGTEKYLMDKCVHCKQMAGVSSCDHCGREFRL